MMKGNEKDCICAKNPRHTKECDAFRLSEFLIKSAAMKLSSSKEV